MATVTITKQQTEFLATAGNLRGRGQTMGEALDSLVQQGTISVPIIIHQFGGDKFFTQKQYDRMQELRRRVGTLSQGEQSELEALIDAQLDASQARLKASQRP